MKKILYSLLLVASFAFVLPAHAQVKNNAFGSYFQSTFGNTFEGGSKGDLEKTLPQAVGSIISAFLAFIGVILLVVLVYAGFLWITAGGNDDQVKKAKKYIINGVIGLIIALSAFIITSFVVSQVTDALKTQPTGGGTPSPGGGSPSGT